MQRSLSGSHLEYFFGTTNQDTNDSGIVPGADRVRIELPAQNGAEKLQDEIRKWEDLWQVLVSELVQVVDFPPFLVRNGDTAREALRTLTIEACRIALNPQESEHFKEMQRRVERQERLITELQKENAAAQESLKKLSETREQELSRITGRIQKFECLVRELNDTKESTQDVLRRSLTKHLSERDAEISLKKSRPTKTRNHTKRRANLHQSRLDVEEMQKNVQDPKLHSLVSKYTKSSDLPPAPDQPPRPTLFERSVNTMRTPKRKKSCPAQRRL